MIYIAPYVASVACQRRIIYRFRKDEASWRCTSDGLVTRKSNEVQNVIVIASYNPTPLLRFAV